MVHCVHSKRSSRGDRSKGIRRAHSQCALQTVFATWDRAPIDALAGTATRHSVESFRKLVGVGRLALPRLFGFEPNRSSIPNNHTPARRAVARRAKVVGDPGLAPGRLSDLKS